MSEEKKPLPTSSKPTLIEPLLPPLHCCGGYQGQYSETALPKTFRAKANISCNISDTYQKNELPGTQP